MQDLIRVLAAKAWIVASLLLTGILIARQVTPAEFGLYAAAIALVLMLDGSIGSALDLAGVKFGSLYASDAARVDRLLGQLFRLKVACACGLGLSLIALIVLFDLPAWPPSLGVAAAVAAVSVMLMRSLMNFLQIRLRFTAYSSVDLALATLRLALVLAATWMGVTVAAAYLGLYGIAALLVWLVALALVPQRYLLAPAPGPSDRRAVLQHVGLVAAVVALGTLTGRSDIVILELRSGPESAGHYAAAFHISSAVTLVAAYASVVSQPRIVTWVREGRLAQVVKMSLLAGIAAAALPIIGALLFSDVAVWIFGAAYADAAPLLTVLLLGVGFDLLVMPLLLPYALQLFPWHAFVLEAIVACGYFTAALGSSSMTAGMMAVTVTLVRAAKLLGYLGVFAATRSAAHARIDRYTDSMPRTAANIE